MSMPEPSVHDLLLGALQRFVAPEANITRIRSVLLRGGMSGSAVSRHTIEYTTAAGPASISLITKDAHRHEWRALEHLQTQQQPNIPFAHAIDTSHDERLLFCLQDLGDQNRPTSLDSITETELAREAAGLAAIHTANFQQHTQLNWLPSMNANNVREMLFVRAWRPAWETAIADARFATAFAREIVRLLLLRHAAASAAAEAQAGSHHPQERYA
jgi:hypothetical protein